MTMALSFQQIKHILSLGNDSSSIDQYAQSLDMSFGELQEHIDLAEHGIY